MALEYGALYRATDEDELLVMHVSAAADKASLVPNNQQPAALQSDVETANIKYKVQKLQFKTQQRPQDGDVRTGDVLETMVNNEQADFVIVGAYGRKQNLEYMGHVGTSALKVFTSPACCAILK